MARARYDKVVAQIQADLRQERGRGLDSTRLDSAITDAADWFLSTHPDGWRFAQVHVESGALTESVSIRGEDGAADTPFTALPRLSGLWIVKTQIGGTSGDWKPLKHRPWQTISQMAVYNRTASTTELLNQTYWSFKIAGTITATKFAVWTLETFPYSYAGSDAQKPYYQIDYRRQTPTFAAGTNADDAFIWEDDSWDRIITYMAESFIAHELNDIIPGVFDRAWGMARELASRALRDDGVSNRRIHLPPPFLTRRTADEDVRT